MTGRVPAALTALVVCLVSAGELLAKNLKGAEYRTKETFLYGRFEVRLKAHNASGALASFFTYNDAFPSTPWNEIDIEVMGRYTDDVQVNAITPGTVNHVSHIRVPFDPSADFHVYGFEWTPTAVAWFIDGREVLRQTGDHIATLVRPQKLMMNVWVPDYPGWSGPWYDASLPVFAYYDWVKVSAYTPGTGTTGTNNDFTPLWSDEFDGWDQGRWDKATHTWAGNRVDFVHENAVFRDGHLILCITRENALGYGDPVPPSVLWARDEGDRILVRFSEDVTEQSASDPSNVFLSGATVRSAQLLSDRRTMAVTLDRPSGTSLSGIILQNITDRAVPPNVMPTGGVALIRAVPLTMPLRVNVAGSATGTYLADTAWSERAEHGRVDGWVSYHSGAAIAGTADPEVYRSEATSIVKYRVRVPAGLYDVSLQFAENWFTEEGKRVFSVFVEDSLVEEGLDLIRRAGFRTAYQQVVRNLRVSDGVLDVHLQAIVENTLLNGIVIVPAATGVDQGSLPRSAGATPAIVGSYPNPFNSTTTVLTRIGPDERYRFRVYDILGRLVSDQQVEAETPALTAVRWSAADAVHPALPGGVYFCRLEGRSSSDVHRLVYTP